MKNNATFAYALLLIVGDFFALLLAFVAAYILRVKLDPRPLIEQIPALNYLWAFIFVLPLWIMVHAAIGLYSPRVYEKRFSEIGHLFIGSFVGILVVIGYDFVSDGRIFPARLVPVYGLALGFSILLVFRTIARSTLHMLFKLGAGVSNVLIIGDTPATQELVESIRNTRTTGFFVIGTIGKHIPGIKHFESFKGFVEDKSVNPHAIIQTELYDNQEKNSEILMHSQQNHLSYRFIPGNSDLFIGNIAVELFAGQPVIAVHQTALIGWGRIIKRIFDVFGGSLLLIVSSPILLVVSLLQLLTGGKVFFRQTRLTRFNQEFRVYKFRTMRPAYNGLSPEQAFQKMGKPELITKYRESGDQLLKDPRVSKLGRFLRATSLDELPQLFNVLKGDLSLVGPRALVPEELSTYEKRHAILSVKSGLTGLAQVSGRRNINFEERRKLDMYYVQNWSFWLDIVILLKTIRVVLTGEGAK
jgi:exopolysaccharide biosynthesis polyprenyl glycosylphosphotransferase